jgi:hypothetical protein
VDTNWLDSVSERYGRFRSLFDATERFGDLINAFLDEHEELMEFRRAESSWYVGMIVVASF